MSSLGKILAFVNVILAGLFLGWAVRALNENSDWKVKHDSVKTQLEGERDGLKKDLAASNAQKAQLETEKNTLRTEKEGLDAELRRTKDELTEKSQNLAKWSADLNQLSATHNAVVADKEKLQAEKDKAVTAKNEAEAAKMAAEAKQMDAEKRLGDAQTDISQKEAMIADLEKGMTGLGKEKKKVETDLAALQAYTGATLEQVMSLPKIDGKVLAVSMDVKPGLISINKGKADDVKRGFTFQLYEGNKFKGTARVEFVHDTMCSAILLNVVEGAVIRQGDNASTQL
ncbi:MAG: hypothetical protein IPJ77_08185 [Planctomycetes bacterium]|nr:hypothetical protein [Planctomycetota bacterium]